MTFSELLPLVAVFVSLLTVILGYVRLSKMTPLEAAQKISTEVGAQSVIIKDLAAALADVKADNMLIRAELAACKKQFELAVAQWEQTELHLRRMLADSPTRAAAPAPISPAPAPPSVTAQIGNPEKFNAEITSGTMTIEKKAG